MVVERYVGEVGVGELEIGHISAVDLKLEFVGGFQNVDGGTIRRRQVLHGMVEVELLNLRARGGRLLHLGDEHVLGGGSEEFTLLGIEVRVVGVDLPLGRGGLVTPSDAKLDIVVLEGDEGEGGLPVLTEGEAEGVELGSTESIIKLRRNRLGGGGRRESGGNQGRIEGIMFVNHLTTDKELHLGDDSGPVGDDIGDGVVVAVNTDGHEVDIVEHVTLALEADGGHTVVRDVALNDLTLDSLGEVRVTLVRRTEKADFGLTDEVHILSTDSDELGDTTRHFILYREFIFKLSKPKVSSWLRYK